MRTPPVYIGVLCTMAPKQAGWRVQVTDLQVAGVARVVLDPLVPVIPGFGAAVIALRCAHGLIRRPSRPHCRCC